MLAVFCDRREEFGDELSLSALLAIALTALVLGGCGSTSGSPSSDSINSGYIVTPPNAANPTTTPTNPSTGLPLAPVIEKQLSTVMYQMYGYQPFGNHPAHICIPATRKLKIRVVPLGNNVPISPTYYPYSAPPVESDGTTQAYPLNGNYQKLRVRLSIPGTAAVWDFESSINTPSVVGDFSPYLKYIGQSSFNGIQSGSWPEYDPYKPQILGSTPWDNLCTYQEKAAGKCSDVSYSLRQSEIAGCPYGYQKILVTNIVSDFPCSNDTHKWCGGNAMQTVMDYQHWDIKIQAATEATVDFSN